MGFAIVHNLIRIGYRFLMGALLAAASMNSGLEAQTKFGPSLRSDIPFSDHMIRNFIARDGLPSAYIYDVVQTGDGHIWIATHNGVARYDGFRFDVFNRTNTPELSSNDTRSLFEDSHGDLWLGSTGGLVRYRAGRPGQFERIEEIAGEGVHAIFEDSRGRLWIGCRETIWTKDQEQPFAELKDFPSSVFAFCEDELGQIWIGAQTGIYRYQDKSFRKLKLPEARFPSDTSASRVHALLADVEGIWIGTNRGLLHVKNGELADRDMGLDFRPVYDIVRTRNGCTYVAMTSSIYRTDGTRPFEKLQSETYSNCLMEDQEGNLWVGHRENKGLKQYTHNLFQRMLPQKKVLSVFHHRDGSIWCGTANGLDCLRDGKLTHFGVSDGLPSSIVTSVTSQNGQNIWIGTNRGFAKWDGQEISTRSIAPELRNKKVETAFEDSAGRLWFSTAPGKGYLWEKDQLTMLTDLAHGQVQWFFETGDGSFLIGHEYGLYRWNNGQVSEVYDPAFDRLSGLHFFCKFLDSNGTLWLGTTNGIVRYQDGQFDVFTSENGLAADYIDRLATDAHGNLWCASRDAVFFVSCRELDELADGQRKQVNCRRVESLDGVAVKRTGPKSLVAPDGTMWMAVNRGVIKVTPDKFHNNPVPPQVHIRRVELDRKPLVAESPIQFLSGRHRLVFDFSAASYSSPEHVQIQYKLDGYESEWTDAGIERNAHYTDLAPGDYCFRVQAANENGVRSVNEAAARFEVQPRWFETVWFRFVAGLLIAGFSVLTTLVYTRSVRRRNRQLQQEMNERQLAENKLRRSEERFRDLAESTHAIPFEADADQFHFTFVGQQADGVLGYAVADWLAEDFWIQHLHPEERDYAIEMYEIAKAKGGSQQFDCRMIADDGTVRWMHHVLHFVHSNRQPDRVIGFLIDFTDQRDAEQKAENYLDQLERVNRAASMGEMATSIAHEVNQPLFAIVSNAETTKRLLDANDPDIEEIRDALNDIVSDGNRASAIVRNIRSLVQKEKLPTVPLDLSLVADQALSLINPELRRRGIAVKTQLDPRLPVVQGNLVELQQVILNLVLNAAQAMQESVKRDLVIRTFEDDRGVCLQVVDTGIGLEKQVAEKVFEPFFTTRPEGTGMGLAINKTIIDAHHGKILAKPNLDVGTTFEFVLPVAREAAHESR